jgi:hypothetical protein
MSERVLTPNWGLPFVDSDGVPLPRPQGWIDSISRIGNGLNDRITQNETDIASNDAELADHETRITDLETPRTISFQNSNYEITSVDESGVVANHATGPIEVTFPATSGIADTDFFVQNASSGYVYALGQAGEQISGVDLMLLNSATPYSVCSVKSDGSNWIMTSDMRANVIYPCFYFDTDDDTQIVDEAGNELIFVEYA